MNHSEDQLSRGLQQNKSKEASDRLMSIIRTLACGVDVEQREKEKERLEREYKESDKRLDSLVQVHQERLTSIIKSFSQVSSHLTSCQERIRSIKDYLQSCKNLLHCKRDELRRLWLEGIEQKTIVGMLDQIEGVKEVNDKLHLHIQKKQYLQGTELLVRSLATLEMDLGEVVALKDVKQELLDKKEELVEILLNELNKQVYSKSLAPVVKGFQRHGSQRSSQGRDGQKPIILQYAANRSGMPTEVVLPSGLQKLMAIDLDDISRPQTIIEEQNPDPDSDPVSFIAVIVECLALLKKMPEAVENVRAQMRPGLLAIVFRSSQHIYDNAYVEGECLADIHQPQYLLEILQLLFAQFRVVIRMHEVILANLIRVKNQISSLGDFCVYSSLEVCSKIQVVLEMFLNDYLDAKNSSRQTQSSTNFDKKISDLNSYFAKKRGRSKKFMLFRFASSSHALSIDSYMREQRQEEYGTGEMMPGADSDTKPDLVCKPQASNITTIYIPLKQFTNEMERLMKAASGTSILGAFLRNFVEHVFLNIESEYYQSQVQKLTRPENIRQTIDLRTQKELEVFKPILSSTVGVARCVEELQKLMADLPDFADHFIYMICQIVQDYQKAGLRYYECLVMSDHDEKRIISAMWARDEDISRLLRSLPNWRVLKDARAQELSEEDLRAMNHKESSILTSNLSSSEALIPPQELIQDVEILRAAGHIVESMEWFSNFIRAFMTSLEQSSAIVISNNVLESNLKTLADIAQDFQDVADLCLLVLHLEVRVHCFYHLLPAPKSSNYSSAIDDMDPDSCVIQLNKDLTKIEEALAFSLQPGKFQYIFGGMGHLVSTILINSTQFIKRMNENGIKKMCRNIFAVQQCLTGITQNRESDLDHARNYYELLYLHPEEMLNMVVEHGPKFTEQEYTNLVSLAHRSERNINKRTLEERLGTLQAILKDSLR